MLGRRTRTRSTGSPLMTVLGPACMAAVAYVDPGNVAADVSAGASSGYLLVWVLVIANVMAMVIQYLSAKPGIVPGKSLPEVVGESLPRRARLAYRVQAELWRWPRTSPK